MHWPPKRSKCPQKIGTNDRHDDRIILMVKIIEPSQEHSGGGKHIIVKTNNQETT